MQRINTDTGLFRAGDPSNGIPGTIVTAEWLNGIQEELIYIITQAGLEPSQASQTQLYAAMQVLFVDKLGIPEWSATMNYVQHAVVQKSGKIYQAAQASTNKNPELSSNSSFWHEWMVKKSDIDALRASMVRQTTTIPTSKTLGDVIYAVGKGLLEWRTIGSWSGYASLWLGKYEFDTSTVSRSLTIEAVGGIFSKTTYPALWAWAQANNHVVAASSWVAKEFKFADLGGNNFKVPDMRNVFIRGTGTDADNANVRVLGSYQADAIKTHTIQVPDSTATGTTMGVFVYGERGTTNNQGYNELTYHGAAETRPMNTALAPRIIAY